MYYGNANPGAPPSPQAVWDQNYQAIYHLPSASVVSLADSTANGKNGTAVGAPPPAVGQMSGAVALNGSSQGVYTPALAPVSTFTVSAWVNPTDGPYYRYIFGDAGAYRVAALGGPGYIYFCGSNAPYPAAFGTWAYVVYVQNGSSCKLFVNGVLAGSNNAGTTVASQSWAFGMAGVGGGASLLGSIDELRFSSTNRSDDWIKTEYNNQNNSAAFWTIVTN